MPFCTTFVLAKKQKLPAFRQHRMIVNMAKVSTTNDALEEFSLHMKLKAYKDTTDNAIMILIVKNTGERDIGSYTQAVAKKWHWGKENFG